MNSHITTSPAHGNDAAERSSASQQGMCAYCGQLMLLGSIQRHFKTACEGNPDRQSHPCPQCRRDFTRKDALGRHMAAPQACPGAMRAIGSPRPVMGPGPARTVRTRRSRQATPYVQSPASSSRSSSGSSSGSRHRVLDGHVLSTHAITPETSVSPPVAPGINWGSIEECHGWTQPYPPTTSHGAGGGGPQFFSHFLNAPAECSVGVDQHSQYFERPRAPWSPSANFVPRPHEDLVLGVVGTSAAGTFAVSNAGCPQALPGPQEFALGSTYPTFTQEPLAFNFLHPTHTWVDHLGDQVAFDAQLKDDGPQYPLLPADCLEPQGPWEFGAAAPTGEDFGGLGSDIFNYIIY